MSDKHEWEVRPQVYPALRFLDYRESNSAKSTLRFSELTRVRFYVANYQTYQANGYTPVIPSEVLSVIDDLTQAESRSVAAVENVIHDNFQLYTEVSALYQNDWQELLESGLWDAAAEVIGPVAAIQQTFLPTMWGTVGSNWNKDTEGDGKNPLPSSFNDGIIYVRTDMATVGKNPSLERKLTMVHEFVAHSLTTSVRRGTPIDEEVPRCSHQNDKEWLMDAVTGEIMIRLGYLPSAKEIPFQERSQQATDITRSAFYIDPFSEVLVLKYPGRMDLVVEHITTGLRNSS